MATCKVQKPRHAARKYVNHTTETVSRLDTSLAPRRRHRVACRVGGIERQRPMRPVAIVVIHEYVEDVLKMGLVQNQ
jgi:hypothetical protein